MNLSLSIFPYKTKVLGLFLVLGAIPFAYLYFWGGKPDFFESKVFAIVSTYTEMRYFVISQTNLLDELAALFFLSGLTLISFSKERKEEACYEQLRIKALVNAMFFGIAFWILSFFLVYGLAIFVVSFGIFIVFLLAYNVLFRIYFYTYKKQNARPNID